MDYPKQYLLSTLPFEIFPEWKRVDIFGWHITLAPDVPVIRVRNSLGEDIGLLFGWLLSQGRLLADGEVITSQSQSAGIAVEYDDFCGRFNYIYWHQGAVHCITDAGGLLSPVYNAKQRVLASTPTLLKQIFPQYRQDSADSVLCADKQQAWYAFGTTPYSDVRRLLPNHRLSLRDWTQARIFPAAPASLSVDVPTSALVCQLAAAIEDNMTALLDAGHTAIDLTGARDTRQLLAACRKQLARCQFQTFAVDSANSRLHCHLGRELSRRFGLDYRELSSMQPKAGEVTAWRERVGTCIRANAARPAMATEQYLAKGLSIVATGAGLTEARYWYPGDERRNSLSARDLLMRMDIAPSDTATRFAKEWLQGLRGYSVGEILDLAYMEMRLGCCAGAGIYGATEVFPPLSPFNSRTIYRGMLSLPAEYRAAGRFVTDYVALLWPELLTVPFDRARGLSKLRFIHAEIRTSIPRRVRAGLKRIRWQLCASNDRFKYRQASVPPPSDA